MASDWEWLKVEIMYRSSSPGLAGKKWQKTSSMSSKMIVVFPVPPAPIKRHACCVRFRKGGLVLFFLQCNIHCFSKPSASRQLLRSQLKSWPRLLKCSHLLSHCRRWLAKGSPFCFWTLGFAVCSWLHCVISASVRGSPPRRQAVEANSILGHGGTLCVQ